MAESDRHASFFFIFEPDAANIEESFDKFKIAYRMICGNKTFERGNIHA